MKKIALFTLLGCCLFLFFPEFIFSDDKQLNKQVAIEVNDFAIEKLGLSLEEISLLFSFKREVYIGPEVIDEYLDKEHVKKLLKEEYLVLKVAADLDGDLTNGDTLHYFSLTDKARILLSLWTD